jgi:branched-chain amino acid transport system permease protein
MDIVQVVISGLLLGGIYALLSVGVTLVLGVVKFVNFAQGELLMIGMYATLVIYTGLKVHPYLALPVITLMMFALGAFLHFGLLKWTVGGGHYIQIVVTLGLGLVLQSLAQLVFGGNFQSLGEGKFFDSVIQIGQIYISVTRLITLIVSAVVTFALIIVLDRTLWGKAVRATAMDQGAAQLMGIKVKRIYLVTMGIGSALAGIAGVMLMPIYPVYPTIGTQMLLIGFIIVTLGGLGSVVGAFIGSLIVGVIEALAGYWIDSAMSSVMVYLFFIIILLVRPQGIMKGDVA